MTIIIGPFDIYDNSLNVPLNVNFENPWYKIKGIN